MDTKRLRKPVSRWHGVVVVLHDTSCAAAALCRNSRFLSSNAPRLPLEGCDHPESCRCVYRHFDERRVALRRLADIPGKGGSDPVERNRRTNKGRRENDKR